MSVSGTRKTTAAILPGSNKAFPNHARAKPHVEQSPFDITVKSIAARAPGQLRFGGVSRVGALTQKARLFPVGDYPPTPQEFVVLRIPKSRPHRGCALH